jgi:hypothetical protein
VHDSKRGFILVRALYPDFDQLKSDLGSSLAQGQQARFDDLAMIGQDGDPVHRRQGLPQQGQALNVEFRGDQGNARNVAARVRPTLGDAGADWVCTHWRGDNRDCARRCAGRMNRPIGIGDDDIGFVANQCLCQLRHLLRRPDAEINGQIAALDKAACR